MHAIFEAVDAYKKKILDAEEYIWKNPETGYREVKTSAYMAKSFEDLGYTLTMAGDIPGFYTVIDTGRAGPTVLILAELDSLICAEHPDCNPETYAVHACGHHAQCAAMLGIAAGLKAPGALDTLSGKIKLCLVPAEEMIELEYRRDLIKKG
ncbi:MAG: amidohydrolase, partial [Clostridia bacterium]|nr:amidohydrolase [Clostridia bacterium]